MLYVGLDMSLTSTGVAVIKVENRKAELIETYTIKTNAEQPLGKRLNIIYSQLDNILEGKNIECIISEKGFSRHNTTTQKLFMVHGISVLVAYKYGKELEFLMPSTVKKTVAGNGKATKTEVLHGICDILNILKFRFSKKLDESDAVAVALSYLKLNDLIDTNIKGECKDE